MSLVKMWVIVLRRVELVGKVVLATKRISEKYTVMCHGNGLLFMTTNKRYQDRFGLTTHATRRSVAETPYF